MANMPTKHIRNRLLGFTLQNYARYQNEPFRLTDYFDIWIKPFTTHHDGHYNMFPTSTLNYYCRSCLNCIIQSAIIRVS